MDKIKAVNLGGWLVLERWMNEELFARNHVKGNDETCFVTQVEDFQSQLEEHWDTYITNDDLDWIKAQGINVVRIPFPWWIYGENEYARSIEKLDQILLYLQEIDLDFMLDLHTAPGCQNGFDNGGIQNVLEWPNDQKNIDKTIEVLVNISKRYKENKNFHSIQLLNEPNISIDLNIIQDFYLEAYKQIRQVLTDNYIVMHDGFRLDVWEEFFTTNSFHNVILDTHMYQCFDQREHKFTIEQHEKAALSRAKRLKKVSALLPVIVGEWSLGMRPNEHIGKDLPKNMKRYADAQLKGMHDCAGHVFWSYKVRHTHHGWHFRRLVEEGIIDLKEY